MSEQQERMIPPITREHWCRFWKAVGALSVNEEKAIDLYSEILGVYEKQFDDLELAPPKDWKERLARLEGFERTLDEALNSDGGVYRP